MGNKIVLKQGRNLMREVAKSNIYIKLPWYVKVKFISLLIGSCIWDREVWE